MPLFDQDSTAYRLNYLWYTKQAIADAINDVGKNKGISVNPRQDFAKFAEKILKLQTSVWSSAFIKVEPVGNENPRAEHWFEYIDEYFQPSEDITVDPSKQYYKQPPHSLIITENGYYKVSDLSLREFGEADAKTVASSFYVNVQSAPIIIGGDSNLEAGTVTNKGNESPRFNSDRTYTSDVISNFLLQASGDLGFTYTTSGSDHTITFYNGIQMILSDDGNIKTVLGDYSIGAITDLNNNTIKVLQNENTVFFWVEHMTVNYSSWPRGISAFGLTKPITICRETEGIPEVVIILIAGWNADFSIREDGWVGNCYQSLYTSLVNGDYGEANDYIFYNLGCFSGSYHYPERGSGAVYQKDLGSNLFYGPEVVSNDYPASCELNGNKYISLMPGTNLWQRIES